MKTYSSTGPVEHPAPSGLLCVDCPDGAGRSKKALL